MVQTSQGCLIATARNYSILHHERLVAISMQVIAEEVLLEDIHPNQKQQQVLLGMVTTAQQHDIELTLMHKQGTSRMWRCCCRLFLNFTCVT